MTAIILDWQTDAPYSRDAVVALQPFRRPETIPLSFAQQGLWRLRGHGGASS
jgi:hypothetical protein